MGIIFFILYGLVAIMAIIIITIIIIAIVSAIKKNNYNNAQPVLTVDTKVVSKRTKAVGKKTTTYYYVTFEVESSDRLELRMKGNEFGMLVEGDNGQLTFQGDRYLGFKRG